MALIVQYANRIGILKYEVLAKKFFDHVHYFVKLVSYVW